MRNLAAKAAACPDSLERKEHRESRVDRENQVPPGSLEIQGNHQLPRVKPRLHRRVNLALKVSPDLPVHQDLQATQERLAPQAAAVTTLLPAPQDQEALLGRPVRLGHPVAPVRQAHQLLPNHSLPVLLAKLATSDPLDPLVLLVNQAWMDPLARLDPRVSQAHPESPEPTGTLALPAPQDPPEPPARRVSARNTAPSMVVSSSKTELVVKFINRVYASFIQQSAEHPRERCFSAADQNIFPRCRVDDVPTSSRRQYSIWFYASPLHAYIIYICTFGVFYSHNLRFF
jgi:hypothetical protein